MLISIEVSTNDSNSGAEQSAPVSSFLKVCRPVPIVDTLGLTILLGFWGIKGQSPGDLNGDMQVNGTDLTLLLGNWGNAGVGDLNDDGNVDGADLGLLLGAWGARP